MHSVFEMLLNLSEKWCLHFWDSLYALFCLIHRLLLLSICDVSTISGNLVTTLLDSEVLVHLNNYVNVKTAFLSYVSSTLNKYAIIVDPIL